VYIFIKIVLLTVTAAVYVVSIISPVSREYMLSQPASQHFSSLPFERNYYIHGATESELSQFYRQTDFTKFIHKQHSSCVRAISSASFQYFDDALYRLACIYSAGILTVTAQRYIVYEKQHSNNHHHPGYLSQNI